MVSLTKKEREIILILLKDYTTFYNANSISKIVGISSVGAQKILKRLLLENLVINKTIGKSIVYKLNFQNNSVNQLLTFLLADEANNFKRWKEEFKELFEKGRIVIFFGSAIKNYAQAHDIDLMIVMKSTDIKEINEILRRKEEVLPKKIHAIKLTSKDLLDNLKKRDKVIVDIVKNGIVLFGQEKYIEVVKNVASF